MSASNTNYLQGIVLALKAMWKTCTNLSKKASSLEEQQEITQKKMELMEVKLDEVVRQHLEIVKQVKQISILQSDIAKQVINQHQETEALLKGLGLKKDLSYYSFNLHNEEGH